MSAATATPDVEDLMPAAVELAEREGIVPSRDRLMSTFRIGRPKAREIHRRLQMQALKAKSRRARKIAERLQKAPFRRDLTARVFDPSAVPVSPGVGPADPWSYTVAIREPEGAPTSIEGPLPTAPVGTLPAQVIPKRKTIVKWPLLVLAQPAFVAVWSGWVGLGEKTGFGIMHPLPGIADWVALNTAITLPIGLETYGTYALYVWLSGLVPARAQRFAMVSAIGSLALGMGGQVAYHLMQASGIAAAPWWITTIVSCIPVAVLGIGAALYHLVRAGEAS